MNPRAVHYVCRKHGEFVARVTCGFKHGPAPKQMKCPVLECFRLADRKQHAIAAAKRDSNREVSVTAETYARLKAHCDANGISMAAWIEAHTQDLEQ